MNSNKQLVRSFAEAGNTSDFETFETLLTANFTRHCQATPEVSVTCVDDFKNFYMETAKTFPDQKLTLDKLIAEDNQVAFWGTFTGTQDGAMGPFPATGKKMSSDCSGVFRIEGNKIAELWVTWDNLSGLSQLGLFP